MDIDLTVFPTADACRIARISVGDLENWQTSSFHLGTTVAEGRRTRRLYSAADLIHLRCVTALCGPTPPGYRQRMFASPALAFAMVASVAPFEQFIEKDEDGCLRAPLPDEQWFACFGVAGRDTCATYDLLNAAQLAEQLTKLENQVLIIPVSRLVFEVLTECGETTQLTAHTKAVVARLDAEMTQAAASVDMKHEAEVDELAARLTSALITAVQAAFDRRCAGEGQ